MGRDNGRCAFFVCLAAGMALASAATAGQYLDQAVADTVVVSVSAQRVFASALPSAADYSQTAHVQNEGGDPACDSAAASHADWVMWDVPFMQWDRREPRGGGFGHDFDSAGFATGIGRLFGDAAVAGLALGYDHRELKERIGGGDLSALGVDGAYARARADAFHAALYGGAAVGCFFVDVYAGYSRSWTRARTGAVLGGVTMVRAAGAYGDHVLSAGVKASYVWILPNEARLVPAVGLDYSHVRQDSFAFTDVAGGATVPYRRSVLDAVQAPLTIAANKTFASDFLALGGFRSLWTPEARAGWVAQFGDRRASVASANGLDRRDSLSMGGSYGVVGAGVKVKLRDKYIFAVDYDFRFQDKYTSHLLTASYGMSF